MDERPKAPAANLYRARRRALWAIAGGIVAGFALGVPLSHIRGRGAAPWEPYDMFAHGSRWAAIATIGTTLVALLMHRYVALYERGKRVKAKVVTSRKLPEGPRGVVVRFTHANGETRYSWLRLSRLKVGSKTSTIVGSESSKLVLHHNPPHGYTRSSALTKEEVAPILKGGFGADQR